MKHINDILEYTKARALQLLYEKINNKEQLHNIEKHILEVQKIIRKEYNLNTIIKYEEGVFNIIFY